MCLPRVATGVSPPASDDVSVASFATDSLNVFAQSDDYAVIDMPPSTESTCPVMYDASGESRNATAPAMSSG